MTDPIALFTIGFTRKPAAVFFGLLKSACVSVLVDVRLRPDSQLSGFARRGDLGYFCRELAGCEYRHQPDMTPTATLLDAYREHKSWDEYARAFNALLDQRELAAQLDGTWWASQRACLLCSEHEPEHCHRRLVAEYLQALWPNIEIIHLM